MKENPYQSDRELILELTDSVAELKAGFQKIIALQKKQGQKDYYDLQELSEKFHLTKRSIRNTWLKKGLPFFKIGSRILVNHNSLMKYIEQHSNEKLKQL